MMIITDCLDQRERFILQRVTGSKPSGGMKPKVAGSESVPNMKGVW